MGNGPVFSRAASFALDQLHHQVVRANVVKRADVGEIERGNGARLALETGRKLLVHGFDGNGEATRRTIGGNVPSRRLRRTAPVFDPLNLSQPIH